jgi:hypothetical protein
MDSKQVVKQTARVVQNYLTYQAVCIIIDQLTETNPPLAIRFRQYSSGYNFQEAETYLQELMQENKELALRVMTVREDLAERVLEFLPPMVSANINQDNMEHRRQLLERITYSPTYATDIADASHPELDINDSTN